MLNRRRRLAPLAIACLIVGRAAGATTPCADEPGSAGLVCRTVALAELAVDAQGAAKQRIDTLGVRARAVADACARGRTGTARRRLRALRSPLEGARRALSRSRRGRLDRETLDTLLASLRLLDALRRATTARFATHPCPELVEILRPGNDEAVGGGDAFVLLRLAPEADPGTLTARLAGQDITRAHVSATQAWGHVPCAPGRLEVTIADRAGAATDTEGVDVACRSNGLALGGAVEVLVDHDHTSRTLRLTPVRPLRSGATYAVIVTRALEDTRGRGFRPSADFARAAGLRSGAGGPHAYFARAADDPRNPFPSERLVRADGTVAIPDGFTARALPAETRLDGVRSFLRGLDARSALHRGYSPNTPVVLQFDAPVTLESATPASLLFVEVVNPGPAGTNLGPVLDAAARERGIASRTVALATVFPVEDVAGTMAGIREQIATRAAASPPGVDFADPNPSDARRFGVFRPGDSGFAELFGGAPPATVGAIARGRFPSPEYRADTEGGRFAPRFVDGSEVPPYVPLECLLALPAGAPPFPTVIVQHGFAGDDTIVTQLAGELAAAGLAAIGIPAPEHGPRGDFFDFFDFDDFNAFGDNWRQASVDLLQLVRLIEHGIDLDGDGANDLRAERLGYLGVSLGGVIGGVFTALEPAVTTAVLNVPGGRLAQIAGAASPFAEPFLARFAEASGIPVRVCGEAPTDPACALDADCASGHSCLRNPDFTLLLEAAALDWQTQLDPGDGAAYARWLRLEPRAAAPRAVLVQEGIDDIVLGNPLTEALARAVALPANQADAEPAGVAGLWRYPPPTGHAILSLPEVRRQAIGFLASEGATLAAP